MMMSSVGGRRRVFCVHVDTISVSAAWLGKGSVAALIIIIIIILGIIIMILLMMMMMSPEHNHHHQRHVHCLLKWTLCIRII